MIERVLTGLPQGVHHGKKEVKRIIKEAESLLIPYECWKVDLSRLDLSGEEKEALRKISNLPDTKLWGKTLSRFPHAVHYWVKANPTIGLAVILVLPVDS